MTNYITYEFNTDTVSYPLGYDSSKLNLGHLIQKNTDENGNNYVSPIEPKFLRGYEILSVAPFSYAYSINSLGSLKYNDDTIWLFYAGGGSQGTIAKRIFLATYKKSINEIQDIGSIQVNYTPNATHSAYSITPSMEKHTGGTITVIGNSVTGSSTTWLTDGVCVGNRIGFGSSISEDITTWYEILVVNSDTSITLTKGVYTDGNPNVLSITGSTQYVIEDFRLIYANPAGSSVSTRGISLVKGLRYELFQVSPTTIPAGTTIDNIRACYRLLDNATTSAIFYPIGSVLEEKTSFTQQDYYVLSYPASTSISIQKFNIRASLTLTLGRSDSAFVFTTGNQLHGGTNTLGYNPMSSDFNGNYYVTHSTRISRIPTSGITNGSTTFIVDAMIENPPGTSTTFPLSSSLVGGHYLRQIDKFYVGHTQGTIRNYITSYVVGGEFDKPIHINDQPQQSTYLIDKFNYLTNNFLSSTIYSHYNDGISFLVRDTVSNNNIIYVLPIEADKDYHTLSNSCVITPEITTLSATSYNKVYLNLDNFFNTNQRFYIPRENCDIYYRTSGITSDTGSWTLVSENGEISGSSSSIQFKLTFRTIGLYSIPNRIKGIVLSYDSPIPLSIPFYEPSLKFTDKSSQIFTWRQNSLFSVEAPAVMIDIYDSSNNLLLSDDVNVQSGGTFEYSSDDGVTWNNWSYSANSVGNYLRYSSSTLSASGLIVKPILFPATPTPTASFIPTPTPTNTPTPTPTPIIDPDATAFISAASITGTTEQSAINQLVFDLKNFGLWAKLKAVYPFVGGTAFSHKFNLKNPLDSDAAFRLLFSGVWTHSSNGVQGDGSTAWANTFYNLSINVTLTDISAGVYCRTNSQFAGVSFGAENTSSIGTTLALKWSDTNTYYSANDNLGVGLFATLTDTRGFFVTARSTDTITTKVIYRNGALLNSTTASSPALQNLEMAFNARTRSGTITSYDNREYAFFFIGDSLTSTEQTLLYGIIQNYQTTLGRQV